MRQLDLISAGDVVSGPIVFDVIRAAHQKFGRVTAENRAIVGQWCAAEVDRRLKADGPAVDRPTRQRQAWAELSAAAAQAGGVDETPAF
jgi:hypothetical protein